MESDKEHIRHCLLFCFHQKKSTAQNYLWDVWWKYYSN